MTVEHSQPFGCFAELLPADQGYRAVLADQVSMHTHQYCAPMGGQLLWRLFCAASGWAVHMFTRIIDLKHDRPVVIFAALTLASAAFFGPASQAAQMVYLAVVAAAALYFIGRAVLKYMQWPAAAAKSNAHSGGDGRAVAHDLRTHISIILLQLNKVPDPRVRAAEDDLKELADAIDNLFQADKAPIGTTASR